jgi:hypothetical protein
MSTGVQVQNVEEEALAQARPWGVPGEASPLSTLGASGNGSTNFRTADSRWTKEARVVATRSLPQTKQDPGAAKGVEAEEDKAASTKTKATVDPNSHQEPSEVRASGVLKPIGQTTGGSAGPALSPRNYLYKLGIQKKNQRLFKTLNCSTKDCFICSRKKRFVDVIADNLNKKYLTSRESYNAKVVNDIIYNENTHIVAVFKDYLIFDDVSEFLKRLYGHRESQQRLPKVYDFYEKYSKVFPNYVAMEEKRFMFKNIERKQRQIDELQKNVAERHKKKLSMALSSSDVEDKVFTPSFLSDLNKSDSILGRTIAALARGDTAEGTDSHPTQIHAYAQARTAIRSQHFQTKPNPQDRSHLVDFTLRQLVDKFLLKDTQSSFAVSQLSQVSTFSLSCSPADPRRDRKEAGKAGAKAPSRQHPQSAEKSPLKHKHNQPPQLLTQPKPYTHAGRGLPLGYPLRSKGLTSAAAASVKALLEHKPAAVRSDQKISISTLANLKLETRRPQTPAQPSAPPRAQPAKSHDAKPMRQFKGGSKDVAKDEAANKKARANDWAVEQQQLDQNEMGSRNKAPGVAEAWTSPNQVAFASIQTLLQLRLPSGLTQPSTSRQPSARAVSSTAHREPGRSKSQGKPSPIHELQHANPAPERPTLLNNHHHVKGRLSDLGVKQPPLHDPASMARKGRWEGGEKKPKEKHQKKQQEQEQKQKQKQEQEQSEGRRRAPSEGRKQESQLDRATGSKDPGRMEGRRHSASHNGSTRHTMTRKPGLAIDIETLNRHLRKQQLVPNVKVQTATKALPKHNEFLCARTPEPALRRLKSDYLQALQQREEAKYATETRQPISPPAQKSQHPGTKTGTGPLGHAATDSMPTYRNIGGLRSGEPLGEGLKGATEGHVLADIRAQGSEAKHKRTESLSKKGVLECSQPQRKR